MKACFTMVLVMMMTMMMLMVVMVMMVMMMIAAATHPHAVCLRPAQHSHAPSCQPSYCTAGLGF